MDIEIRPYRDDEAEWMRVHAINLSTSHNWNYSIQERRCMRGLAIRVLQYDREQRPIHVVWGVPAGYESPAVLITAYRPNPDKWNEDFVMRRK